MSMMASTSDGLNDIQQVPEVIAKFLKSSGKKLQNGSLPWQLYLGVLIASTEKLQKVRWNPGVMMMLLQIQREGVGDYETLFFFMNRYYGLVEPYLDYVVKVPNIKDADNVSKIILHHSLLFYLIHFHFKKTDMNMNYYRNMNNLVSLFTESQLMIYRKIKNRSKDDVIIGQIEEDIALNILGALHFLLDGETVMMLEGLLIGRYFSFPFYYKIYGNVVRKIGTRVLREKTLDVHSYILKMFSIKLLVKAYEGIKESQNEILEKARKNLIPTPEYLEILKNGIFKCILKTSPDISKLTEFLLREDFCLKSKVNEYFDMIQYKKPVMSSKENNFGRSNSNEKKEEGKKQEKIPEGNHSSEKRNKTKKNKSPLEGTKREIRDSIKCSIPLIDTMKKKNNIEDYNKLKKSRSDSIKTNKKSPCCGEVIKSIFFIILESNRYEAVKKHCEKLGYYYPRLLWNGLVGIIIENHHTFAYVCSCLKILLKKTYNKLDLDVILSEFFTSLTPLIINNIVDIDDSDNKILDNKCVDLELLPFGSNEETVKILTDVNINIKNNLNFFPQIELNFMENNNIVNEMLVNWGEISLPSESLNNELGTLPIFNEVSNKDPSFSYNNQNANTLSYEIASQLTEENSIQTFPLQEQTNFLLPGQCSAPLQALINVGANQLHTNSNESMLFRDQDSPSLNVSSTVINNNIDTDKNEESMLRAPNEEVIKKPDNDLTITILDDEPEQINLLRTENTNTTKVESLLSEAKDKVIEKSSYEIIEISDDEAFFNVNPSNNGGVEKSCEDSVIKISDDEQSLNDNSLTPVNFYKNPNKQTDSFLREANNELYDKSNGELIMEIPNDETSFIVNSIETNCNINICQNVELFSGIQNEVNLKCHDDMIILNPDDIPTINANLSTAVNIDINYDENEVESLTRIPNEEIYEKCQDDMIILNPDDIPTLNVNLSTAVNVNINPDKNEVVSLLVVRNEVYEYSHDDSSVLLTDDVPSLNDNSLTAVSSNVNEALLIMPVKEVLENSCEDLVHVDFDDAPPVNVDTNTAVNFNKNPDKNEVASLFIVQNEGVYKKSFDDSLIIFPDNVPINAKSASAVSLIMKPNSNEIESMLRVPCEGEFEKCADSTLSFNEGPLFNEEPSLVVEGPSVYEEPSLVNEGPSVNEDPSLVNEGPSLVDEGLSVNEEPSLVIEGPSVNEEPSLVNVGTSLVDEGSSVNEEPSLVNVGTSLVDEGLSVNEEPSLVNVGTSLVDEGSSVNEEPSLVNVGTSLVDEGLSVNEEPSLVNVGTSLVDEGSSVNEEPSLVNVGTSLVDEESSVNEEPSLVNVGTSLVDEESSVNEEPSLVNVGTSLVDEGSSVNEEPSLVNEGPSRLNYLTDVYFNVNANKNEVVSLLPVINESENNKPYDTLNILRPDNVPSINDKSTPAVNVIINPCNYEHPDDLVSSDLNSITAIKYNIKSNNDKVKSLLRVPSEDKKCDETTSFISDDVQYLKDNSSGSISVNIVPDKNKVVSVLSESSEDTCDDSIIPISNDLLSFNVNLSTPLNLNTNPDKHKTESLLTLPNEKVYGKANNVSSLQIPKNVPVNPSSMIVNFNIIPDKNKIVSVLRAPNEEPYGKSGVGSIVAIPDDEPSLTDPPRAINSDKHTIKSLLKVPDEEVYEKSNGISTNISCPIVNKACNELDKEFYFPITGGAFSLQSSPEKVLDLSIKKQTSHDANFLPFSINTENTFIHESKDRENGHDKVSVITSKPLYEISNKMRIKAKAFSLSKEMFSDNKNSYSGVVNHKTPTFNETVAPSNTTYRNIEDGVLNQGQHVNNLSWFAEKMLDSKKDFVEKSIRQVKMPLPTELDNNQPSKRFKNSTSSLPSPTPSDSASTLDHSSFPNKPQSDPLVTEAPNRSSAEDKAHFPCFRLRLGNDGNATLECHCLLCVMLCSSQNDQNKLLNGTNNTTGSDEDHNVLVRLPIKKRKLNMDAKYNQSSIKNIVSLLANPCSSQTNLSYYPTSPMVSIANMDNLLKNVSGLLWFKNAVSQNSGGPENTPSEPSTLTVLNATSYKPDTFIHNGQSSKISNTVYSPIEPNNSYMNSSNNNKSNIILKANVDSERPQLSNVTNIHNPFLESFINSKDNVLNKLSVPSSVFPSGTEQTIFGRPQSVAVTGGSSNGFLYTQYAHNNYENRNVVPPYKPIKSRRPRRSNRSSVIQNSVNTPYYVAGPPRKRQTRAPRRSNRNTVIQNSLNPPFNAVSPHEIHEASIPWSSNRSTVIKNPIHEPYNMARQFQQSQASLPPSEIPQPMFAIPYNNGYYFPQYFNFLNR